MSFKKSDRDDQDANITKLISGIQKLFRDGSSSDESSSDESSDDSDWKPGSDDSDFQSGSDSDDSDFESTKIISSDDSEENDAESGDNSVSIDSNHVNNKPVGRNWSDFLDGAKSEQELDLERINKFFKNLVERELLKNTGEQQLLEELTTISNEPTVISQPHSHASTVSKTEKQKLLEELTTITPTHSQAHSHTLSASKTEKQKLLEELTTITQTHSRAHSHGSTTSINTEEQKLLEELINLPTIARSSSKHNSTSTETLELDVGPDCPFKLGQQVSGQLTLDEINFNGFLKKVGDEFQLFHAKWLHPNGSMSWHLRPEPPNQPTSWGRDIFENNPINHFINTRAVGHSRYVDGVFKGISRKGLYIIEHFKNFNKWLYFRPELVTARHDFVFEVADKVLYWNGNKWEKAEIKNQNDDSTYNIQIQGKAFNTFNTFGVKEEDLFLDLNLPKGPLTTMNESLKDIADEIRQLREAMGSMNPGDFRQELERLKAELELEIHDNYNKLANRDKESYHKLAKWIIRNIITHRKTYHWDLHRLSGELDSDVYENYEDDDY